MPELSTYTPAQLAAAGESWPCNERYLRLLTQTPQSPADELRRTRHRAWLRCALATFFKTADTATICAYWSEVATHLLQVSWQASGLDQVPLTLFALGKLGAHELNLSSDVDLLIVREDRTQVRPRWIRNFQNLLGDATAWGFCLRLDFDLRPGGRAASLIPSEAEFEHYYGYYGETWERLALVRLKPLCGDSGLGERILKKAHRFSYRRHLDYTLFDDLRHLRPRIHSSYTPAQPDEYNLKLGVGGIRDIELFIHALQVANGGKNPNLRTSSTTQAVESLIAAGVYAEADARFLIESYWHLRSIENRLQARDDQQTYLFTRHDSADGDFDEVVHRGKRVDQIVSRLLGTAGVHRAQLPAELSLQQSWLRELNFSSYSIETVWPELIAATAQSKTMERDERARQRFLQSFVEALDRIGLDRDLGLSLLRDFSKSVRAKATFFSLFLHEPKLIDEVARLFSTSPYLGHLLASRPELLDSFIFRKQDVREHFEFDIFLEHLADRKLLSELISSTQFLARRDLPDLLDCLTQTADQIATQLIARLTQDFPSSNLQILALGKWGGFELGLRSDLDFIFITPDAPNEDDHKVARRFISRISESHQAGAIYSIDLRLRPSGKAGPLISSVAQLKDYLDQRANVWERQAYLRSRALTPAGRVGLEISARQWAAARGVSAAELAELAQIRTALLKTDLVDLKLSPGGLVDIEFTAQIALLKSQSATLPANGSTLAMIEHLSQTDPEWRTRQAQLSAHYQKLRITEQLHRLTGEHSGSAVNATHAGFQRLAQVFGVAPQQLSAQITHELNDNSLLLKDLDPFLASR